MITKSLWLLYIYVEVYVIIYDLLKNYVLRIYCPEYEDRSLLEYTIVG